jgi:cytidylate kinase
VRDHLIAAQRAIISSAPVGIVAEGRDIGTVVAPHAQLKVFLTADPQARARRRAAERGAAVDATEAAQARRDRLDAAQSQMAADAVLLDATELTLAKVIEEIARLARERSELACTGDKRS